MNLFLAGLVVSAVAILVVLAPLRRVYGEEVLAEPRPEEEGSSPRAQLLQRKAQLLEALRDLDFEFATGKLVEADYRPARDQLMAEATEVVKALDEPPEAAGADASREQATQELACHSCGAATRQGAAFCQSCGARVSPEPCPACGRDTLAGDRFCSACGTGLARPEGD